MVTIVTIENFSRVLEMFLKLDYVFASLLCVCVCVCVCVCACVSVCMYEVELEISFSTYFIVGWTRFHLNEKNRKWKGTNRHLLGKNLRVFLQNSTFFIAILTIILKIDASLKSFLAMQFFDYCLNQIFTRNFLCS